MGNLDSLKMKVRAMPIFSNDSFTESDEEICNPKRRISFNQNVHVFDMSKPAPKSPKRSRNTGNIQSKAFLDEVINELQNHQQKVNNDLVTIPVSPRVPPKNENNNKSYLPN